MKKIYVQEKRMTGEIRELLNNIIAIVEEYEQAGYSMTLRQLYYQLVSRDIIPNKTREYDRLGVILADARLQGKVDWDFIVDRVRKPQRAAQWDGIPDLMETALNQYRCDRWSDQNKYVEVWVEKDALSGVLAPITEEYHVTLMVNRGYSSITAMHDASIRFKQALQNEKDCVLLYFGDHDPSGEDMVHDVSNRLNSLFGCASYGGIAIQKIALTYDQIEQYAPPPNPVKVTDTRARSYIAQYGEHSWELDALPPNVLVQLLREALDSAIDMKKYKARIVQEYEDKKKLREVVEREFGDGKDE